jgi:hypothetical protein
MLTAHGFLSDEANRKQLTYAKAWGGGHNFYIIQNHYLPKFFFGFRFFCKYKI